MICQLSTKCSIIPATNAKGGNYDCEKSLQYNTGFDAPLLGRFDLVFCLINKKDPDWAVIVTQHILNGNLPIKSNEDTWSFEKMKSYFSLIKSLTPTLTEEASDILSKYYTTQRQAGERNADRTTVRMLESLIR